MGEIKIEISGAPLDLRSIGVLHVEMANMIEAVFNAEAKGMGKLKAPGVRAVVTDIRIGSLLEEISLITTNPHIQAIGLNLASNLIWAIGCLSGINVKAALSKAVPPSVRSRLERDPYGIEPFFKNMLTAVFAPNGHKPVEIRMKHIRRTDREEITIVIKM